LEKLYFFFFQLKWPACHNWRGVLILGGAVITSRWGDLCFGFLLNSFALVESLFSGFIQEHVMVEGTVEGCIEGAVNQSPTAGKL
jgi:hypothetical protein